MNRYVLAIGFAAAAVFMILRRLRVGRLPSLSDTEFVTALQARGVTADAERIIRERRFIASGLGIPATRVTPDLTLARAHPHSFQGMGVHVDDCRQDLAQRLSVSPEQIGMDTPIAQFVEKLCVI